MHLMLRTCVRLGRTTMTLPIKRVDQLKKTIAFFVDSGSALIAPCVVHSGLAAPPFRVSGSGNC